MRLSNCPKTSTIPPLSSFHCATVSPGPLPGLSFSRAYPNPFHGQLNVLYFVRKDGEIKFTVFGEFGKVIKSIRHYKSKGSYTEIINLEGYMNGMYVIKVEIGGQTQNLKVFKN